MDRPGQLTTPPPRGIPGDLVHGQLRNDTEGHTKPLDLRCPCASWRNEKSSFQTITAG